MKLRVKFEAIDVSSPGICFQQYNFLGENKFEQESFTALAEGRIVPVGFVQHIQSVVLCYDLSVPVAWKEPAMCALKFHARGCPAHQSVKESISITWSATLRIDGEIITLNE